MTQEQRIEELERKVKELERIIESVAFNVVTHTTQIDRRLSEKLKRAERE